VQVPAKKKKTSKKESKVDQNSNAGLAPKMAIQLAQMQGLARGLLD